MGKDDWLNVIITWLWLLGGIYLANTYFGAVGELLATEFIAPESLWSLLWFLVTAVAPLFVMGMMTWHKIQAGIQDD